MCVQNLPWRVDANSQCSSCFFFLRGEGGERERKCINFTATEILLPVLVSFLVDYGWCLNFAHTTPMSGRWFFFIWVFFNWAQRSFNRGVEPSISKIPGNLVVRTAINLFFDFFIFFFKVEWRPKPFRGGHQEDDGREEWLQCVQRFLFF